MTKIGVGVGEDFPIEDKPDGQGGQTGGPDQDPGPHEYGAGSDHHFHGCGHGWDRTEWRAHRAEWRRNRHKWKAEHREWRRRFKAEMRERIRNGDMPRVFFPFPFLYMLVPMLIGLTVFAILVTGVVTIVASAPFVVIGLVLLFILYAAHRRHNHHHFYYGGSCYDATPTDGSSNNTPPPAEGH